MPRGSLSERGGSWFTYRGQEVEFYHRNLNGIARIEDLLVLEHRDLADDERHQGDLNLTEVDAARIILDLQARGLVPADLAAQVSNKRGHRLLPPTILHPNQYNHLADWLEREGLLDRQALKRIRAELPPVPFTGI